LLRKENFEIAASFQLAPWQAPTPTRAVIDTGAGPSVVRADMLPDGWSDYAARAPARTQVSDASGQLLKVNGEVTLTMYVGGTAMEYDFLVVKSLSVPLILGWDFQQNYVEAISPKTQTITWDDGTSTVAQRRWAGVTRAAPPRRGNKPKAQMGAVRVRRGVTVGPRFIQAVKVYSNVLGVHLVRERPVPKHRRRVLLHNAVMELTPDKPCMLYLTNLGDKPVHVNKGYVMGVATAYNGPLHPVVDPAEAAADAVLTVGGEAMTRGKEEDAGATVSDDAWATAVEEAPPPKPPDAPQPKPEVEWANVPGELRGEVEGLLAEYEDLWGGQLGKIDVTPHRIEVVPGARPRRAQPYRASLASRGVIAAEVKRQRHFGVIEPSSAEWAFPVVLCPKPDGTMRFCVVYRRLNEVTVRDVYPLPRMDECIDFLGDAKVFSTLDCNAGYWQIPVLEEDRDKTTFVCHEGAYRYIRLPFGLSNAPATFQRAIDMILGGLKWKHCLVYLDDIIVFSQTPGEHVEHLREVFAALSKAGVSLKAKKCHLFQEEVEYLGHIVGRGELKVQDKNIRGLREASPPRCKKDLRSFLGMCNVYRRFIKDYARVARPLSAMTSTKGSDRWTSLSAEALAAFEDLKKRLTEAPILALPRREGAYTVDTDASAGQIGAVLLQEQPDRSTRPVGYWSRSLNAAERNYSTTERECLAAVWASLLLRPYVEGTRFTVRTDHAALK